MKKSILAAVILLGVTAGAKEVVRAVLFPFREAVIASRVESRLLPYGFRVGESFQAGVVLVKLDDVRFKLEKKRAEDQYKFSLASFENKQKLRERNFTSDFELKKAEFEKNVAENALQEAVLNFSYCQIEAPFDGKIVEILTREFEIVRPGQPICRIIDDNSLLAVMNVPVNDAALTTVGNVVRLKLDSGKVVAGSIYEVSPQADHRTGTRRIRVKIDNRAGEVTAGATGVLIYGN